MVRQRSAMVERMRRAEPAPEPTVLRIVGGLLLVTGVVFAVWSVLNRQAARGVLDANRRRWGDL